MGFIWLHSATKHGVTRQEAIYVIKNALVVCILFDGLPGETTKLYIGYKDRRSRKLYEVMVASDAEGRRMVIFHAMHLRKKFKHLLRGSHDGNTW